uniref:Uncharacterized protein n=2 Tax=Rhodosorus marinus TaxID=101924 RepID=A0A7S0G1C9_9RHOD|mmetsp:Transcript_15814/g.23128  ORF Transcript_15814/g.23128 Transcript_15814/m.23128 type:complete len:135 (+) Transcript_15814:105-509(+)
MSAPAWDLPYYAFLFVYKFLRPPRLQLGFDVKSPATNVLLPGSFDKRTGAVQALLILPDRLSGQFALVGFIMGLTFLSGGAGLIYLIWSVKHKTKYSNSIFSVIGGISASFFALKLCESFLQHKLGTYLQGYRA